MAGAATSLASSKLTDRAQAKLEQIVGLEWQPLSSSTANAFRLSVELLPKPTRMLVSYDNANCEALANSFAEVFRSVGWPVETYQQATNPIGISVGAFKESASLRAAVAQAMGRSDIGAIHIARADTGYREIAIGLNRPKQSQ